jgi:hypothetical protein
MEAMCSSETSVDVQHYYSDQIMDEIGGLRKNIKRLEMYPNFWLETLMDRNHTVHLCLNCRLLLNIIMKKQGMKISTRVICSI